MKASQAADKKMVDPKQRAKAYKEYFSTLDADTLRGLCKEGGHESKGTKSDMVERLSKPGGAKRARSGSPLRAVANHLAGHHELTKKQEWAVFAGAVAILAFAIFCALVFHQSGGDPHKFLDHFGSVGATLKGALAGATGAAKSAAGATSGKK